MYLTLEALTVVIAKSTDVLNVTPCSLVDDYQRFVGASCLHLEVRIYLTATIVETEGSLEIVVTIYLASHLKRHYSKGEYLFHRQCSIGDQHHSEGSHNPLSLLGCLVRCHLEGSVLVLKPAATPNLDN